MSTGMQWARKKGRHLDQHWGRSTEMQWTHKKAVHWAMSMGMQGAKTKALH